MAGEGHEREDHLGMFFGVASFEHLIDGVDCGHHRRLCLREGVFEGVWVSFISHFRLVSSLGSPRHRVARAVIRALVARGRTVLGVVGRAGSLIAVALVVGRWRVIAPSRRSQ